MPVQTLWPFVLARATQQWSSTPLITITGLVLFLKTRPAGGLSRAILCAWTRRFFLFKKSLLLEEVRQQCWPQGLRPYEHTGAHLYYVYNICHVCQGFTWVTLWIMWGAQHIYTICWALSRLYPKTSWSVLMSHSSLEQYFSTFVRLQPGISFFISWGPSIIDARAWLLRNTALGCQLERIWSA